MGELYWELAGDPAVRFSHVLTSGGPLQVRGVCVNRDGFVYVCDYHNDRVQVF